MSRIRDKNTQPEIAVRKLLYGMGYRYRLHGKDLPGKPDIIFKGRKKAIFVNGCFWHGHEDPSCKIYRPPRTRTDYWHNKIDRNRARDIKNISKINDIGWECLVIWECELKNNKKMKEKLIQFLGS